MSTLRYTQRLEEAGFNRRQAEEIVTIQQDAMNDNFATKNDLERMQLATKAELQAVRAEMASEFQAVRAEMASEFQAVRAEMASEFKLVRLEFNAALQALEHRMIIKLGAMQVVGVGIILTALQYLR
jgi:hypothetical protein